MNSFAHDVYQGLRSKPKYLPSMYFYDETGDKLFKEITRLDEYYLTRAEEEILKNEKEAILKAFSNNGEDFDIIELGPGDGMKSRILLSYFLSKKLNLNYFPIDISSNVLSVLEKHFESTLPGLDLKSMNMDYFQALQELKAITNNPKVVLFMGSNIGNFDTMQELSFLRSLHNSLSPKDMVFIGFDLKKDPKIILNAYNDSAGITRDFNLNYLKRINRELGGNFDLNKFVHKPNYNPISGEAKSFLRSQCQQNVLIDALKCSFRFEKDEDIFMEVSRKYDLDDIKFLARKAGFHVKDYFFDEKRYFANVLWQKL